MIYSQKFSRLCLRQVALGDDAKDLTGKFRLCKAFVGVWQAKVVKYVSAAVIYFDLFFHACRLCLLRYNSSAMPTKGTIPTPQMI